MPNATTVRFALGFAMAVASASGSQAQQGECRRPPARRFADGETVVIAEPKTAPCLIQIVNTPIELRSDAAGEVPNFVGRVARAPDGRFFTSTGFAEVAVWNADGKFAQKLGREGRGPGEFARGALNFHVDTKGRLYVRDNNARWSIFSPSLELVRTMTSAGMQSDPRRTAMLDDGMFLSAGSYGASPSFFFHLYDFTATDGPALVKSFGAVPADEQAMPSTSRDRMISYAGGTTFWASPPATGRGYELEMWGTDGTRRRTLRREAPWFPKGADRTAPPAGERSGQAPPRPPAQVVSFHEDGSGLIFVAVFMPNSKWGAIAPGTPAKDRDAKMDEMADLYLDVIDANAGVLLASAGPMPRSRVIADHPVGLFARSRQGFRAFESADGLPGMRIVEYKLVAK